MNKDRFELLIRKVAFFFVKAFSFVVFAEARTFPDVRVATVTSSSKVICISPFNSMPSMITFIEAFFTNTCIFMLLAIQTFIDYISSSLQKLFYKTLLHWAVIVFSILKGSSISIGFLSRAHPCILLNNSVTSSFSPNIGFFSSSKRS